MFVWSAMSLITSTISSVSSIRSRNCFTSRETSVLASSTDSIASIASSSASRPSAASSRASSLTCLTWLALEATSSTVAERFETSPATSRMFSDCSLASPLISCELFETLSEASSSSSIDSPRPFVPRLPPEESSTLPSVLRSVFIRYTRDPLN